MKMIAETGLYVVSFIVLVNIVISVSNLYFNHKSCV